jgi:hypothetical protein
MWVLGKILEVIFEVIVTVLITAYTYVGLEVCTEGIL